MSALNIQLTRDGYNQLLRDFDADKNREINFDEFCKIMAPVLTGSFDDDELRYAFDKFDLDKSGEISVQELNQILSKVNKAYSMKQIEDLVRKFDKNGDQKLNFNEFCVLMRTAL